MGRFGFGGQKQSTYLKITIDSQSVPLNNLIIKYTIEEMRSDNYFYGGLSLKYDSLFSLKIVCHDLSNCS